MKRFRRLVLAWMAIVGLVFAQLAAAAYACPAGAPAQAAATGAMPCGEMDQAAPELCQRHCHGHDSQSGPADFIPPPFAPGYVAALDPPSPARAPRAADPPQRRAAAPPLAFHHRFRL